MFRNTANSDHKQFVIAITTYTNHLLHGHIKESYDSGYDTLPKRFGGRKNSSLNSPELKEVWSAMYDYCYKNKIAVYGSELRIDKSINDEFKIIIEGLRDLSFQVAERVFGDKNYIPQKELPVATALTTDESKSLLDLCERMIKNQVMSENNKTLTNLRERQRLFDAKSRPG